MATALPVPSLQQQQQQRVAALAFTPIMLGVAGSLV
jgi:hypothetical protein